VREFLVTHLHRDHYTQAVAVRRITGSSVSLGAGERVCLDALRADPARSDVRSLHAAGAADIAAELAHWHPDFNLADWEYPDRWLGNGVDVPLETRTLRVIATPGHTRGHVVFHDAQAQTLFAGDHVLPHITPSIAVEVIRPASPLRDYLASLQLVRRLPDTRLLPAHGPVAKSTHARIDQLLTHHDRRLTATAEAVAAGASTGYDVARRLGWTRHDRRLDEMDLFNKTLAVQETMAHLQVLVERGWLTRATLDGVVHFRRA
jgi:glyoxylase-like metal-dependent hydrolase (beta-lactamase superfamily II)